MLTMGPFVELFETNRDAYYAHMVRNLTAFQFGFLGAYVYFIGSVVRAYFTLDLTSHTFVDGSIRMIVASIDSPALVLSFAFDFAVIGGDSSVRSSHTAGTADTRNARIPSPRRTLCAPAPFRLETPSRQITPKLQASRYQPP